MAETQIRFDDGASYERMMGTWSRIVGEQFLDWMVPPQGLRWIDIGCGNGAFTQMIADRCAPSGLAGIDPSEGQLSYARNRPGLLHADLRQGNAMELPFDDAMFDAATMALVIFFVPEPAKGVAELARVLKPGGIAATYAWDMLGGGFPLAPIQDELRKLGNDPTMPPSAPASRMTALQGLWRDAGFTQIDTREFTVQRRFADFDAYWSAGGDSATMKPLFASLGAEKTMQVKEAVRQQLKPGSDGSIIASARANAIKGVKPR